MTADTWVCLPVRPSPPSCLLAPVLGEPQKGTGEDAGAADDGDDIEPHAITSPKEMTPEAFAQHCLTHLPYDDACWYCAATRKPNAQHRRSPGGRTIPLLVADYGFLTEEATQESVPYLAVQIRPWRLVFATVVDSKGVDQNVIRRLAQSISDVGLTHFAYRSDREPAIRKMLAEAVKLAGVEGEPDEQDDSDAECPAAVPEESRVGDSRTNG